MERRELIIFQWSTHMEEREKERGGVAGGLITFLNIAQIVYYFTFFS